MSRMASDVVALAATAETVHQHRRTANLAQICIKMKGYSPHIVEDVTTTTCAGDVERLQCQITYVRVIVWNARAKCLSGASVLAVIMAVSDMLLTLADIIVNTILCRRTAFAKVAFTRGDAASVATIYANVPAGQSEIFVMLATNEKLPGLLS